MGRQLTEAERAVLVAMIRHGMPLKDEASIHAADRKRWLYQVPGVLAGPVCECGTCPSIELVDEQGPIPPVEPHAVLTAATRDALVLLFIHHDQPSYLEFAPTDDRIHTAFPAAEDLIFTA